MVSIKKIFAPIMLILMLSIFFFFGIISFIFSAFIGFFLLLINRFKRKELNEYGYVEKIINPEPQKKWFNKMR